MTKWLVGVDFGQASDRTAICALETVPRPPDADGRHSRPFLDVRFVARRPLGEPYPAQCAWLAGIVNGTEELRRAELVCDATGVGRAVIDELVEHLGRPVISLSITGGARQKIDGRRWSVPKRDLAAATAVAMQQRRVRVSRGMAEAETLYAELASFTVSISDTGHDTYEAAGGQHDDLALSASYAIFAADRGTGQGDAFMQYWARETGYDSTEGSVSPAPRPPIFSAPEAPVPSGTPELTEAEVVAGARTAARRSMGRTWQW